MDDRQLVSQFLSLLEKRANDPEFARRIIGNLATEGTSLAEIKAKVLEQHEKWKVPGDRQNSSWCKTQNTKVPAL